MGGDLVELLREAPLRVPQIEGFLHPQPQTGSVAAELAQAREGRRGLFQIAPVQLRIMEDLDQQAGSDDLFAMSWDDGGAAVGVFEKVVTTPNSYDLETQSSELCDQLLA